MAYFAVGVFAVVVHCGVSGNLKSVLPVMVDIPPGSMMMGYSQHPLPPNASLQPFPNGDADERPHHVVYVSKFQMSATEVTNLQYEQFDPSHHVSLGMYYCLRMR